MRDIVWRTDANARPWDVEVPRPTLKKCAAGIWSPPPKTNGRKKRPSNAMKKRPSNAMSPEEAYALKERDERDPKCSIQSAQKCAMKEKTASMKAMKVEKKAMKAKTNGDYESAVP